MSTTAAVPNVATVANAKDRLEQANFKMGKAQTAAIMSSAVARQDAERLDEITRERDAADVAYREIVKALTAGTGHTSEANADQVRARADDPIKSAVAEPSTISAAPMAMFARPVSQDEVNKAKFLFGSVATEMAAGNGGAQPCDQDLTRDPLVITGVELQDFDRSAG